MCEIFRGVQASGSASLGFIPLLHALLTYQQKHVHQLRCQHAKTGGNQTAGTVLPLVSAFLGESLDLQNFVKLDLCKISRYEPAEL